VAAGTIVAALAVTAGGGDGRIVVVLGGAAEIGLLLYNLNNPRFIRHAVIEQRRRELSQHVEELSAQIDELDAESRIRMRGILQLYKELQADADDPDVQDYAEGTLRAGAAKAWALTDRALRLAKKKKELQRYLDRVEEERLEEYVQALQQRAAAAADQTERIQYEQALRLKTRELEDYRSIAASARRIDGQLENIECAFSSLKARIVRLKAADVTQWGAAGEQLRSELDSLSSAVETLEQSVNEALSI